jgi:hypothetical protein
VQAGGGLGELVVGDSGRAGPLVGDAPGHELVQAAVQRQRGQPGAGRGAQPRLEAVAEQDVQGRAGHAGQGAVLLVEQDVDEQAVLGGGRGLGGQVAGQDQATRQGPLAGQRPLASVGVPAIHAVTLPCLCGASFAFAANCVTGLAWADPERRPSGPSAYMT